MIKQFSITKVYTKNIVTDSFQFVRNTFGLRLRGYERMINQGTKEITEEMNIRYKVKWYRLTINPMIKGSVMITVYGEGEGIKDYVPILDNEIQEKKELKIMWKVVGTIIGIFIIYKVFRWFVW
jgi:hypothetical protein